MNKKYQKNAHQLHYKKRNNLKIKRIAIISALVLLVLGVIAFCIFKFTKKPVAPAINPNVESQTSSDESTSSSQEPVTPKLSKVRFISAGDNLIHDTVYSQAKQRAGGVGYDFKYAYENLESVFALADLKTLNQETVLSSAHKPSGYPMFNTPQENADYLIKLGFNVFNHATNHVLDKGVTGINSTLDYWKNHPDVLPTGVYANKDDATKIQTITKNDITFAFLGMTESLNGLALPKNSEIVINRTADVDKMVALIKKASEISDVVILNVHWGSEYSHSQTKAQETLAQTFVDAGADVIVGHHPHVIQPVKYLQNKDGKKALVAFSLGNLVSSQDTGAAMIGGLLDYEFTKNLTSNTTEITNARFIPIVNHYERNRKNIRVYPLDKYTKELGDTHGIKYPLAGYGNYPNFSLDYIQKTVANVVDKQFLTDYKGDN